MVTASKVLKELPMFLESNLLVYIMSWKIQKT